MASVYAPQYLRSKGRGGMSNAQVPPRAVSVKSDSSGSSHTSNTTTTHTTVAATNAKKQKGNGLSDSEVKQLLDLTMKRRHDMNSLTSAETRQMLYLTQKEDGTVGGGAKKARRKRWQFPKDLQLKKELARTSSLYFANLKRKLEDSLSHEAFLTEKLRLDNWLASEKATHFAASAQRQYPRDALKDASKEATDYKRAWGVVKRLEKKFWEETVDSDGESALTVYIAKVIKKYKDNSKFLDTHHFTALKTILEDFYESMKSAWTTASSDAEHGKKDRIAASKAKRTAMAGWRKTHSLPARPRQMRQGLAFETGMSSLYEQDSYDDDY